MRALGSIKKLDQIAVAIDRIVTEIDVARLPLETSRSALAEIDYLSLHLGSESAKLKASLAGLHGLLERRCSMPEAKVLDHASAVKLRRALKLLAPLFAAALALSPAAAMAGTPPPPPPPSLIGTATVGGTVYNPVTGANETVTVLIGNYAVRTNLNNVILLATKVGDTYTVVDTSQTPNVSTVYTVTAVTLNSSNVVTDVTVKAGSATTTTTTSVVQAVNPSVTGTGGGGTGTPTSITFTPAAGDIRQFTDYQKGGSGGDGSNGGGVGFCIPLIGCVTIGKSPTAGGNGSNGPLVDDSITASHGNITTVSPGLPGVVVVSAGGDGGKGGDSYALSDGNVLAGAAGGAAGNGGTAIAHVSVGSITTSGDYAHGILVQSMAGAAGAGGKGIVLTNGGSGGTAAAGGSASAYNRSQIVTTGKGAVGILVQSLGGNAGAGGSSYGFVGLPGSGSVGGDGGTAYAENSGAILTTNESAHGMLVQSIGGSGGNSGSGGGIVVLGSDSGAGGNGGTATGKLLTGGSIETRGNYANGLMVQSVGGSGGAGGVSGGLVALGSSGGAAGVGNAASAITESGSSILTKGDYSYGILVESIGGGGGSAGSTGGLVSIGAKSGSGGNAGNVSVTADGTVETRGTSSRGIFAQSVGGGGGNAGYTGGAVAIGGSGALGGTGGRVDVSVGSTGGVKTLGAGADAIFAQSVGGGGGAGSYAGGLVSLGGSGGPGAGGGIVTVDNAGTIETHQVASRGIFAQSVGGGGGSGGDTGGLVSIGGTGGGTSAGGNVTVTNSGSVTSVGNRSYGIQAQSIGGGGGDGGTSGSVLLSIGGRGAAGGSGGTVVVNQSGAITTSGNDSHALFAQSVGGGGGNGGSSTTVGLFAGVALGGAGSIGGQGGDTTVAFTPKTTSVGGSALLVDPLIITHGDRSRGVFAQSVGGGGGSGGFAVSATFGVGFSASVGIGGSGGGGNLGGLVTASGNADVRTDGKNSEGMFFQSAGGGGGSGGYSVAAALTAGPVALTAGIGGTGGSGGDGGTLSLHTGGTIITRGMFSTGFVAQSVGGGGGTGGYNISAAVSLDPLAALAVGVGIGGAGGGGGAGGTVTADFNGNIQTGGDNGLGSDSIGALIQSVGGGGGRGGYNITGAASAGGLGSAAVAVGIGGSGGSGGDGGTVTGSVDDYVITSGARSTGVLIQSVGGGGGSGGFNVSGALSLASAATGSAAIGLGGTGGTAGKGGTVTGTTGGTILTKSEGSDGLVVQSLGGGGGSGGFNVSGAMGLSEGAAGSVAVGLGGAGGGGGDGGITTGSALDNVETLGERSRGVVVQSLGGGGGAGAFNISGGIAVGGGVAGNVGVGLGGAGGSGGNAMLVTASAKSILTHEAQSAGFIAQSVGGGGGTGGFNVTGGITVSGTVGGTVGVGLGGSGGSGGTGGQVIADVVGNVVTNGNQSGGILAQSLGGGGGSGAFNVTGGLSAAVAGSGTIGVGIGGSGGGGGASNTVDLTLTGAAGTIGTDSDGIVAQSVGGGGGAGAFNVTGGISLSGGGAGTIGVGIGGSGGSGGSAERVGLVVNAGTTTSDLSLLASTTHGARSRGIVAQSVGGGGGSGAFNVTGGLTLSGGGGTVGVGIGGSGGSGGSGGIVNAAVSGITSTVDNNSDGIFIQSLGGGGGAGAFNITGAVALTGGGAGSVSVGLGGSGGSGGGAQAVTLALNNDILNPDKNLIAASTTGTDSRGIVVQSLGGGGGSGGINVAGSLSGSSGGSGAVSVGIGGSGGSGGGADTARADITGMTLTTKDNSGAILVQSLGGGGGTGGINISGAVGLSGAGAGAVGIGIGGSGGGGGNAQKATLNVNQRTGNAAADLVAATTAGDNSDGIVAQSIGGGGGSGGFNIAASVGLSGSGAGAVAVGIGGSGGSGGDAGDVASKINGQTTTGGDNSDGIVAQAIGGGGGAGGFNVAGSLAAAGSGAGGVSVGIGGSGGSGGLGGVVNLDINAGTTANQLGLIAAQTAGTGSRGIVAQSLGGGGGSGGFDIAGSVALSGSGAGSVSVGIGGSGGGGKNGLAVTAGIAGSTLTSGSNSDAIFLQSLGGGGGTGGFNVAAGITASGAAAGSVQVGIGGSGGGGGSSDAVTLNLNKDVLNPVVALLAARTELDGSRGIVAQSIGGGGGDGGFNVSGGINLAGKGAGGVTVGIGGSGGGGGSAALVSADITGSTVTYGKDSGGVLLQSLGGGGGAGGFNISGSLSGAGKGAGSVSVGIGGSGANGGTGGAVDLDLNQRTLDPLDTLIAAETRGDRSAGIVAQSVGGGGGSGGFDISGAVALAGDGAGAVSVGLGGSGGGGNNSSTVTANIRGITATAGADSGAILAQSVGGGGGTGGMNISGGLAAASKGGGTVSVGLGGSAGSGGSADTVRLTVNSGTTDNRPDQFAAYTQGPGSAGIIAQSLGGGGGIAGINVSGALSFASNAAGAVSVGLGGSGGNGGNAGAVFASIAGTTQTLSANSGGVLAQSIGGGGGGGGFNVSGSLAGANTGAGSVTVGLGGSGGAGGFAQDVHLAINSQVLNPIIGLLAASTGGASSDGIVAQSLGGGGGNGGFNVSGSISLAGKGAGAVSVGIGGSGGGGGIAGGVYADLTGATLTSGKGSKGILLQSLGGGGGNGGFDVAGGIAISGKGAGTVNVGIGGTGGGGGHSGEVIFDLNQRTADPTNQLVAAITSGDDATAITAQSIGGGGGNGGFNVSGGIAAASEGAGNLGFGLGGGGGTASDGDQVIARINGDIGTSGVNSGGLFLQSAGGGGGSGGFNVSGGIALSKKLAGNIMVGIGGMGAGGGDGKLVNGTLTGDIVTAKNGSFGATLQSLGGSGGAGGMNITGGISVSTGDTGAGTLGVGIGGFGGGGGNAGAVIGSLTGNIQTDGDDAHGALLQSVGGGGGDGGLNVTGGVAISKGTTGTLGFGMGGFGGDGGNAGTVDGLLAGDVTTSGKNSYGAMFQSLGGAGGTGGINVTGGINITKGDATSGGVAIGIGGFGGGGGNADRVTADVNGLYHTDGDNSAGVVALSLGGGGGAGGLNVSGSVAVSTQGNGGAVSFGLGGFGGAGGTAGDVTLTRVGQTVTKQTNSDGVVAQSIGGGGGRGAMNISGGISGTNTGNAGSMVIGIGGFGGGGGDAGNVTATVRDSVFATGSDAPIYYFPPDYVYDGHGHGVGNRGHWANGSSGIVVESVGGGGGSGGMNISGGISLAKADSNSTASALTLGLGGFGGSGGDAGIVKADIGAASGSRIQVQSQGDNESAVYIASIGGGGGDGGMNISGAITTSGQVTAGFGGAGSGGGLGKAVTARVNANLFATGYQASGLTVQSLGGGGGAGGINISGGLKATARTEPVIVLGMGGNGGAGNSSGDVNVQQDGQVIVNGYTSNGILVQSVAGGGGAGGFDVTAAVNRSSGKSQFDGFAAGVGMGGTGGSGGVAGNVSLRSTGDVLVNSVDLTHPEDPILREGSESGLSAGVTVQSIGGGGGVGGFNFTGVIAPKGTPLTIAIGGSGGVGGDAGTVNVVRGYLEDGTVSKSLISALGYQTPGLIAQSIGGGGGNAGTNLAFAMGTTEPGKTGYGGQFIIGGDGASSGNGRAVTVLHAGYIHTQGSASDGILAQSIGKGGGNAAVNIGFTKLGQKQDPAFAGGSTNGFSLALGGAAGNAGSAGDVTVTHDGTIFVDGDMSSAIVAQSLAGGGGNTALNIGALTGADNVLKIGIGRSGGSGGTAGNVKVTASGELYASGDQSNGIVAQSIGGAGGLSSSISVEGQLKSGSGTDATKNGAALSVGLEGGSGGHAGTVTVDNSAQISTDGDKARGILAQSIGGDGGVAGSARTITGDQADSVAVAIGGGGGSAATSSKVTVANSGLIVTTGGDSDGVLAQSIGGGGGVGGAGSTIKKKAGGLDNKSAATIGVAVGGSGGDGAIAGDVQASNTGTISTIGSKSYGIRAQSIGGGGGIGGASYNVEQQTAKDPSTMNVQIGGGGGTGQAAGRVDVTNNGLIVTSGEGASAISANSIGGGGGDAGSVATLNYATATNSGKSNALQVAIGGAGGSGGTGGAIHVINAPNGTENSGTIVTSGNNAHGIFAQSLGGGGGNGSSILSIYKSNGAADSVSLGFNIGGKGGTGNTAGSVTVDNDGIIRTSGDKAIGILAQSIGGGGGNGGVVISANILMKSKDKSPLISIGGVGGAGNDGGHVTVNNSGQIYTTGKNADGIVAQSIGGGGGNAGLGLALTGEVKTLVASNLMSLLVGAIGGGTAGHGGQVDVNHSGNITVLGEGSQAIVAESINGGGGHAHFDLDGITVPSLSAAVPGLPNSVIPDLGELDGIPSLVAGEPVNRPVDPLIVAARAGASDASQMNAGKVNVSITGTIGAAGDYGSGVVVRSVGGGGGAVELRGTLVNPAVAPVGSVQGQVIFAVGLGAKNSSDSSGANVVSAHTGQIVTTGKATDGVLLQSIGGGGGSALVDFDTENASLIDSVRLGLGAVGTSNSRGGDVSRTQTGGVVTTNDMAHGALVQSIGGGGGSAIAHFGLVTPTNATPQSTGTAKTLAIVGQQALSPAIAPAIITLGANGGTGNEGGAIDLSFTGGFDTAGDHANGLIVQSIGAGGGTTVLDGITTSSVTLGGQSGASGSAGAITVRNNGQVLTTGTGANGILLQSIGGGGGALFGAGPNPTITLSSANSGNGGAINLSQTGDVGVLGDGARGILAQSLGGGGGLVDNVFAGTAGGVGAGQSINLAINGQVFAPGSGSTAVAAQSLGSLGGGNITISAAGSLRGGSGTGAGVLIDGGKDNLLTSNVALSAVSGLAVVGTSGNDRVVNNGIAVGNFRLGGGVNALVNAAGATLVTMDTIDLQDGANSSGTFTNAGNLLLGLSASSYPVDLLNGQRQPAYVSANPKTDLLYGTSVISQVALDGNLLLTPTSHSVWDVAFGPYASDQIAVTGNATVNGTADVNLTWLQDAKPIALVTTGGTATDAGLQVKDTLALDFRVETAAHAINLAFTSHFGLPFLNKNEQALGTSMDSALTVGGSAGIGRLLTLLGNLTQGQEGLYKSIMDELDPEPFVAPELVQFQAARDFGSSLFGCRAKGHDDRACVWGYAGTASYTRSPSDGDYRFGQHGASRLRAGVEVPFASDWKAAAAFGYDDLGDMVFDTDRARSIGTAVHGGLGVARSFGQGGRGSASLSLSGGRQTINLTRRQTVFVGATGTSHYQTGYVGATGELGYTFDNGPFFARPAIVGSMFRLDQRPFTEQGLAELGVTGLAHHEWIGTVSPQLQLGAHVGPNATLSISGGATFNNKAAIYAPMRLIGANPAADPALIGTALDKSMHGGGVDLVIGGNSKVSMDFGYRIDAGDTITSRSAHFTVNAKF